MEEERGIFRAAEQESQIADLIEAFGIRGWNLYSLGTEGEILFTSLEEIKPFLAFGPEERKLEDKTRYLLMPTVTKRQRADPDAILAEASKVAMSGRAPFFVEIEEAGGKLVVKAALLIDTVAVDRSKNLCLLGIDRNFASGGSKNLIELPLEGAAWKIEKQLMVSRR